MNWRIQRGPKDLACLHELDAHRLETGTLRHGAVVAHWHGVDAGQLAPAAGLEVGETLSHQLWPVADAVERVSKMDEVKSIPFVGPIVFDIVDFELTVGGDPSRLDGCDVNAYHLGGGKHVRYIQSPDAGAGAQIQDSLWSGTDRGQEMFIAYDELVFAMLQVHPVHFMLIHWHTVAMLAVVGIDSVILQYALGNLRGDRGDIGSRCAFRVSLVAGVRVRLNGRGNLGGNIRMR